MLYFLTIASLTYRPIIYFTITIRVYMNLDFSDDQKFLQSEAKKFLEKEESLKRSRGILEGSESFDNDLWQKIIELGWTGIRIPEEYEGLGLGHLELCVIAEELGRGIAPVPFSSSVYLATTAILNSSNEEVKNCILNLSHFNQGKNCCV